MSRISYTHGVLRRMSTFEDYSIDDDGDDDKFSGATQSRSSPGAGRTADPYRNDESFQTTRNRRVDNSAPRTTKMVSTNWMEKNTRFSSDVDADKANFNQRPSTSFGTKRRDGMKETRSNMDARTFRQDFRGTRVFVQGIPDDTSWQELKDHFQTAGTVVFASVSVDPQTGMTKGHGIVQYETTQMAQNAIDVMRNYPLNGATLFVREDVQQSKNPDATLSSVPKGPTPPTKWKCANEDNAAYMSPDDLASIRSLIKARDDARRRRNFDVSDRIRDELKYTHGVFIDDRLQMWWTAVDGNKVPQTIQDINGDGRWKLNPWRQIPTTPENDACVNADLVEGLLKQRDIARREKDFNAADSLLEQARTSPDGDLELRIHDESRTWRVWTDAPPPRPLTITEDGPRDPRERATRECLSIVEQYAPHKVEEIKSVLKKFEGREFQVLKRLKIQYLTPEE